MNRLRELIAIQAEYDDGSEMKNWLVQNSIHIADLIDAAQEVIRISDRKHDAWDKAKATLAKLEAK